jgi:hypothetical protein
MTGSRDAQPPKGIRAEARNLFSNHEGLSWLLQRIYAGKIPALASAGFNTSSLQFAAVLSPPVK